MLKQVGLATLALAIFASAGRLEAAIVEDVVEVPVEVSDPLGRSVRQSIKVTILRDDTRPRAPFLVLNHGRAADAAKRQAVTPATYAANARYFVNLGFAVFMPVRIGYGATGGPDIENSGACGNKAYQRVYAAGAKQSLSVIEHAKSQPFVDPERGLVVGQSFGGTIAMAHAAMDIPGVLAAVNFAGGGGGRPVTHPEQPCSLDRLTELFASYGATARIPTLWLYSENDQYWGPAIPRTWHKAFVDRGGSGQFVQLPPYRKDGHSSFVDAAKAWRPSFEAFLASCCGANLRSAAVESPNALAPPDTPEAFTRALVAWSAKHKIKQASIVIRRGGRIVHQAGTGGGDPSSPVLLASLSKAITGACIATLVRNRKLGLDWPLSKALTKFFATHGHPKDQRIARVTIAQLLTHRAGFASADDGEDPATRSVLGSYLEEHTPREAPKAAYISGLLGEELLRDPGTAFAYSNAGYMLLGAVIEEAAGQTYEEYCRKAVLDPAGAKGTLDPTWGVLWSTGGWHMAGADYLSFLDQHEPARASWGPVVRDWALDRKGKAIVSRDARTWYALGLRMRDTERGLELWHTGTWRRRLPADEHGPRSGETSLLAVRLADGTSWFVHSVPVVLGGARIELDRELIEAYRAVRRWN